jgi:uncharacterized membrane protein HdeD (DUF308 family)
MSSAVWLEKARENAGRVVLLGVIELIIGIIAVLAPGLAGMAVAVMVGVLLMLGGFTRIFGAFKAGSFGAGALAILVGAFSILAGLILVARPGVGLAALAFILAFYFFVDGITRIAIGFQMKPAGAWGWMVFGGALSVLLGFLIWNQWPLSGMWAVGTLVGIQFIFSGWSMIAIGNAAKRTASTA